MQTNEFRKIFGDTVKFDNWRISIEEFAELFQNATSLSYDVLKNINDEKNYGYDTFLIQCKKDGVLE